MAEVFPTTGQCTHALPQPQLTATSKQKEKSPRTSSGSGGQKRRPPRTRTRTQSRQRARTASRPSSPSATLERTARLLAAVTTADAAVVLCSSTRCLDCRGPLHPRLGQRGPSETVAHVDDGALCCEGPSPRIVTPLLPGLLSGYAPANGRLCRPPPPLPPWYAPRRCAWQRPSEATAAIAAAHSRPPLAPSARAEPARHLLLRRRRLRRGRRPRGSFARAPAAAGAGCAP